MKDRAKEIAISPKYDRYQRGLASTGHKFFDEKTGSRAESSVNEVLTQELDKPMNKKFKTKNLNERFKDNIGKQI